MTKHKSNKPHSVMVSAWTDNDHGTEGVRGSNFTSHRS